MNLAAIRLIRHNCLLDFFPPTPPTRQFAACGGRKAREASKTAIGYEVGSSKTLSAIASRPPRKPVT
jgi:hypothetical protein